MANCKDCIHYEPCFEYGNILDPIHGGVKCDSFKSTADVVEVKHARWIGRKGRDYYTCSNCCAVTKSKDDEYCRHCGAKMGGKPKKEGE